MNVGITIAAALLLIVFVILGQLLKSKKIKGILLETAIDVALTNKEGYKLLGNIYLQKDDGTYTEIDHVLIHKAGLFVIEAKNYSGWIFGDEKNAQWTQTFATGRKVKFFNPIKQNNIHIKALKNHLGEHANIPIYSLVVFGEKCELKDIVVSSNNVKVIPLSELDKTIEDIVKYNEVEVTPEVREAIYEKLAMTTKEKRMLSKEHIKSIEGRKDICPFCKCKLIQRTNKKTGKTFYGCSSYPKCKYTAI